MSRLPGEKAKQLLALLVPPAGHDGAGPPASLSLRAHLRQHRAALLVLLFSLLVTGFVFALLRVRRESQAHEAFVQRADQVAGVLERGLLATTEVLLSVPPYFETVPSPSPDSFRRFVAPARSRHPGMAMIEWAPFVAGEDRIAFEREAAKVVPGYRVREVVNGAITDAPGRASYAPLLYIEPPSPHAVGLDLLPLTHPESPVGTAVRTGRITVSPRFALIEDAPDVPSVSAYAVAYRQGAPLVTAEDRERALLGVAVAVFRLRPVVATILAGEDLRLLSVNLLDEGEPEPRRLLVSTSPPPGTAGPSSPSSFVHTRAFTFGDRTYAARVQGDAQAFTSGQRPDWVLALGVLLSLALAGGTSVGRELVRLRKEAQLAQSLAKKLGMYTLDRKLGEGAMGVVYLGHHALLRRPTAIKVLPTTGVDRAAVERFEREVRVTSQLSHPHTIAVFDYGRSPQGVFYYAMEYLQGADLHELVTATGPLPAARVVHLLRGVVGSLQEAHAEGLVHRDVKPANLMVCTRGGIADFVKVLDFGLVRSMDSAGAEGVASEGIAGTPLYLSPEALTAPDEIRPSYDIYAVGAVAYFLLTGSAPIDGGTMTEIFAKVLSVTPEPPSLSAPHPVPKSLDDLVLRCLEKDPAKRPLTMEKLARELELIEAGLTRWTAADAQAFWRGPGAGLVEKRALRTTAEEGAATLVVEIDLRRVAQS